MMERSKSALATGVLLAAFLTPAQANTVSVSGTLFKRAEGTTFDAWKLNMTSAGQFTVNVMAYEAAQSNIATDGYYAADLNGDGALTWLDPDTHVYLNTGPDSLQNPANHLARCDDINNNCNPVDNATIQLSSLDQAAGESDGSIHFRRDPAFNISLAAGSYLYVIADYRLTDAEAAAGINTNDSFSAPGGFVDPTLDHADYRITFSSNTLNFTVSGDVITASAVPVPAAVWLFSSALAGLGFLGKRRKI